MLLFRFCQDHPDMRMLCTCKAVNVVVVKVLKAHSNVEMRTISSDKLSGADVAHINVLHQDCSNESIA